MTYMNQLDSCAPFLGHEPHAENGLKSEAEQRNEPPCNPSFPSKNLAEEVAFVLHAISCYRVIAGGMHPELDNVYKMLEHALARYQSSFSEPAGGPPDGSFGISLTSQGE